MTWLLRSTTEHSFSERRTGVCVRIPWRAQRAHENTEDWAPVPKGVIQWFWGAPENLHGSHVPGEAAVHLTSSEYCHTGRTADLEKYMAAPKPEFYLQFQDVHGSPAASPCTLEREESPRTSP